MITAWDCLHLATLELVRSTPIKQRLVSAYQHYLAVLPDEQLPLDIREAFAQLVRSLNSVKPLRGEEAVAASVRKMSGPEADECAANIVRIYEQLCRTQISQSRPTASVVMLHSSGDPDRDFEEPALAAHG